MSRPPSRVPPVSELRPIAQGIKTQADRRWSYLLFRRVSIYVTWVVLHTPATPNHVTVLSLACAAVGLLAVGQAGPWLALTGCALLLTYHLLDRVDGEVARYRKIYSLRGIYLDNAGHYLTGAGVFFASTYRLTQQFDQSQTLWLIGVAGAITAMMSRVEKHAAFQLHSQYVMESPGLLDGLEAVEGPLTRVATRDRRADRASGTAERRNRGLVGWARDFVLTLTSFPVVVAAFGIGVGVELVTGEATASRVVLIGLATVQVLAYVALEVANLTQNLAAEVVRLARTAAGPSDEGK